MRLPKPLVALAAAGALGLSACGEDDATSSSAAPTETPTTATATPEADGSSATAKVNANTATPDEIAAALEAAGVESADRWAREVEEYRPYPTDDPDFAKLRDELAKYNPGPGVVDKIVGALEP